MKAEKLYVWPPEEPATITSKRWCKSCDTLGNKITLKGYDEWLWERVQEAAAMRYSLHQARVEALHRKGYLLCSDLPLTATC